MKRYSLTILLVLFAAIGIGAYYAYAAMDRLPEFRLAAVEGDAALSGDIELSGSYGGRMRSHFLNVTEEGSEYYSRQSFYEKHFGDTRGWTASQDGLAQLLREHRDFMRGKRFADSFYKDEQWLIYAAAPSQDSNVLEVELLDLASGQKKRFEADLPEQQNLSELRPVEIQRVGNELHMVVTYYMGDHGKRPAIDYFLCVMDISNGALIRQEKLDFGIAVKENVNLSVNTVTHESIGSGDDVVFMVSEEEYAPDGRTEQLSRRFYTYYTYSFKSGELSELPVEFPDNDHYSLRLSGDRLFLLLHKEQQFELRQYNVHSGELLASVSKTVKELGGDTLYTTLIKDRRIYALLHRDGIPQAVILDAADGTLLYRGEAVYAGPAEEAEEELKQVRLLNLYLRN